MAHGSWHRHGSWASGVSDALRLAAAVPEMPRKQGGAWLPGQTSCLSCAPRLHVSGMALAWALRRVFLLIAFTAVVLRLAAVLEQN